MVSVSVFHAKIRKFWQKDSFFLGFSHLFNLRSIGLLPPWLRIQRTDREPTDAASDDFTSPCHDAPTCHFAHFHRSGEDCNNRKAPTSRRGPFFTFECFSSFVSCSSICYLKISYYFHDVAKLEI